MKKSQLLFVIVIFLTFQSCKHSSSSYETDESETFVGDGTIDQYPDGTYAANVEYYNPNTGTRNTYTLNVDVEDHEITVIHWPNGGWLDDSHFYPEELDSDGRCSFTSDAGYEYNIQITGAETAYTDDSRVNGDYNDEQEAVTCPECGGEKDNYDDVCYDCKRKKEDIEEHTCKSCGQYDTFMFSTDDMCSDCKRKQEDAENGNN